MTSGTVGMLGLSMSLLAVVHGISMAYQEADLAVNE